MKNKIIAIALALTTLAWIAPMKAATVDELQAQINTLLQQIAQLQAQLAAQGGTSTATGCFTKNLSKGMKDAEVTTLQQVLKTDSSVYPEGLVTGYFGSLTEAAVKKFQAKYGIDQVGTVGPATRAKLNALYCGTAQQTGSPSGSPTATPVVAAYGSLSVNKVPVANPAYTYYDGGTYELFAAEYKATGSDITIRKIGLDLGTDNIFPWQMFSTISLWDGSIKLAELAVNQANLIENSFAASYTLNVSGLNFVIPNGQKKTVTVKATLLPTTTSAAKQKAYTVVMNDATVYLDTAGVIYTSLGVSGKGLSATINANGVSESNKANLTVSTASDNPIKGNVIASTSNTTAVTLLKVNIKNDSDVSATLNKATTTVTVQNSTTTGYITSVELWDGSTRLQSAAPSFGTSTSANVTWENFTLPIAANTTKTLTVKAVVASIPTDSTFVSGSYVKANNIWIQGIDANSNIVPQNGLTTLTGNEQYIFVKAPVFTLGTTSFTSSGTDTHPQSTGNAKINIGITANNSDIYVSKDTSKTFATSSPAVQGSPTSTITSNFACTSGVSDEGNYYKIPSGGTANCELNAVVQLGVATSPTFYQVQVKQITWNTSATTTNEVAQTWGWDNFKTSAIPLSY